MSDSCALRRGLQNARRICLRRFAAVIQIGRVFGRDDWAEIAKLEPFLIERSPVAVSANSIYLFPSLSLSSKLESGGK